MSDEAGVIEVGKARVLGIDAEYPGLLVVEVALAPTPDQDWQRIFAQGPPDVSVSAAMHPPRIDGDRITIRPPDDQLEQYLDAVRERVAATNAHYAEIVLPRLAALEPARQAELEDRRRRIQQAQQRLDDEGA